MIKKFEYYNNSDTEVIDQVVDFLSELESMCNSDRYSVKRPPGISRSYYILYNIDGIESSGDYTLVNDTFIKVTQVFNSFLKRVDQSVVKVRIKFSEGLVKLSVTDLSKGPANILLGARPKPPSIRYL